MREVTLTGLTQRDEAFWIGLALLVGGGLIPESIELWDVALGGIVTTVGGTLILVRLAVGVYRLFRNAVGEGRRGYSEARSGR